ncbi:hypothetical protein RB195_015669 [Necator americanus]|uniref:Endonuclease/exonuclease/phosphatase domain-containing protein n=1 Tax=Necator americanus TaxID=51031 RepID=A0ABR1E679_NECAM
MGQSGPLWSLYPLLAIIALCEFCCGVVHLLFCLPLYFLCLPMINGVLGLMASFHAIFLRYPNRFCCTFFFLGLPLAIGVYSIIQGVVSWRSRCHGSIVRMMNVTGAALALLLFAATAFGIFCWFHRGFPPQTLTRHCHWLPDNEAYCLRVIHFSQPYIEWLPPETEREIAVLQNDIVSETKYVAAFGHPPSTPYSPIPTFALPSQLVTLNILEARAYPRSDAHCPRPGNVANMRGLPARGRSRPKKLVRHRQQHPVRLATFNVGTLTGRSRELADSLRKRRVDICCVQETHWKGSKSRELGDGYKLIYHGISNRNCVGIILNESFRNSVTAVDRLSDRFLAVKVDTGEVELRVVSAYAPHMGCSEEEEACFWEDLEQYVQSLEGEEVLLIGGDFNGHVGSRKDGFEGCHGGYGYGARNDDGLRILEYAVASDLIITNTQYRERKSHLITYTSGGRETQIDFWMLRRRGRRLLQDSKVIPTDHVAAQHHLLVMDLKISHPRKRHPRTETQRIKWWNLKDRKEVFFASVAPSTLPHPTRSVEEMWSSTSSVIRLTAENTLGKTTLGKPKVQKATWFWNEEVQAAIREKKSKYKLWWRTRQFEDRDAYLAAKREAKKAVSKAKSDRYKAVYDMLDTREGERAVYRLVRARHRSTLDMEHPKIVKGADGAVLRRPGQILERWREYYNHFVTKSSVILRSQLFPASRVLFYQSLPSKSVLPSQK